jgi:hypothetical protein
LRPLRQCRRHRVVRRAQAGHACPW